MMMSKAASASVARKPLAGGDLGDGGLQVSHVCPLYATDMRRAVFCVPGGGDVEEILEDQVAVLGGDRLRMELHAVDRIVLVHGAHDDAVLGGGGHLQNVRHGLRRDGQRVIAGRLEGVVDAAEDAAAVVADGR